LHWNGDTQRHGGVMETGSAGRAAQRETGRDCLARSVASLKGDGIERRHESLMALAEGELGLERAYAEQIYLLAEEEQLAPIYAFQLIRCGIGVRELSEPEQDTETFAASQGAPPDWVGDVVVELSDAVLERRLRNTFRRFRAHLENAGTPAAAVDSFVAEPDVDVVQLKPAAPRAFE
jgi:hypothetical protein